MNLYQIVVYEVTCTHVHTHTRIVNYVVMLTGTMSVYPSVRLPPQGDVQVHPGAQVHPTAVLGPNVYVGNGVVIGPGARVRGSIILDRAELKV